MSTLLNVGQKIIAGGLIGFTLFLSGSAITQSVTLVQRRSKLNGRYKELVENGVLPEDPKAAGEIIKKMSVEEVEKLINGNIEMDKS
eukprot:snap_masked-scaffold_32-processed-gene-2.17-mRNA-1 protein AED:0.03 eAED:0.03 QI:0/-1/0/1/-1/1/1/0/86